MAARTARRSLGRSILVTVLIAIPVAGMSGILVGAASMQPTRSELVALQLGADADAVLQVVAPGNVNVQQEVAAPIDGVWQNIAQSSASQESGELANVAQLLEGDILTEATGSVVIETPNGQRLIPATEGSLIRPELSGRYDLLTGAAPARVGEIAMTAQLQESLQLNLGGPVTVVTPDGEESVVLVGTYRTSETNQRSQELIAYPGTLPDGSTMPYRYYLLDQELAWDDVLELNDQGIVAASRSVLLGDEPTPGAAPSDNNILGLDSGTLALAALVGAFLLVQVVLLAAASFMVGARQQQRALAVLSSVGGDRRLMRTTVTAGGIVLGAAGGLLGVALGIGAAAMAMPLLSEGRAMTFPGFHIPAPMLLITAAVAVIAGWAAAAVPARIASQVDVVPALRGSRRPPTPRRATRVMSVAVLAGGALLLAGGTVLLSTARNAIPPDVGLEIVAMVLIGLGAIMLQIGIILALPSLLRLIARSTGRASTSLRLAARDAGRNSARTVPVTAAVMTTLFVTSFIMSALAGQQAQSEQGYQAQAPVNSVSIPTLVYDIVTEQRSVYEDVPSIEAAILEIVPDAETATIDGTPNGPELTFDAAGTPVIPEPSLGASIARVFPIDPDCRAIVAYESTEGDPDACTATEEQRNGLFISGLLSSDVAIGQPDDLEILLGEPLTAESRAMLQRGGAVALNALLVENGEAEISLLPPEAFLGENDSFADPLAITPDRVISLPAVVQAPSSVAGTRLLVTPETAAEFDIVVRPQLVIAQLDAAPTLAESDAINALSQQLTGDSGRLVTYIESGPADVTTTATWALVAVSAVIALAASSIAIGLARIDGRRDEAILGAMGAARSLRRGVSFWQAILLAGIGSIIGVLLGVATSAAITLPGGVSVFDAPWAQLAIVAIAVPASIAIGAWIVAGRTSALPTDRSAIS